MPKYVKTLALIGLSAVFMTIISDIILLGLPTSSYDYFTHPTECMAGIAGWRITAGTLIGVTLLPLQVLGLVPLFYGLRPAGRKRQLLAVLPAVHALNMGIAFHMGYAFIANGWKLTRALPAESAPAAEMMNSFDLYWLIILLVMLAELSLCAVVLAVTVGQGKTLYPKWFALCNPLCVLAVVFAVLLILPAPLGGYASPTLMNTTSAIFMALSYRFLDRKAAPRAPQREGDTLEP